MKLSDKINVKVNMTDGNPVLIRMEVDVPSDVLRDLKSLADYGSGFDLERILETACKEAIVDTVGKAKEVKRRLREVAQGLMSKSSTKPEGAKARRKRAATHGEGTEGENASLVNGLLREGEVTKETRTYE